ncbi:MAG: HD domain-containing protein [Promethearchaeota archaeon]
MDETNFETLKAEDIFSKVKNATDDFYFKSTLQITGVEIRQTKQGNPYFVINLRDKTQELKVKKFVNLENGENFEDLRKILDIGNIIEFTGKFQKNWNSIQINKVNKLNAGEYALDDFFLPSTINVNKLINVMDTTISKIKDEKLKQLLEKIFSDEDIRIKFIECPSSIQGHHSYKYGNLEHTVSMIKIFENLENYYEQNTLVNIDLIYAGILLHDIGKILEYSIVNGIPKINTEQRLIGHLILGDLLVLEFINKVEDFPKDLENKIRHLILSHHGRKEWNSPVEPQIIEAEVLHYIDMIDSRFKTKFLS